MELIGLVLLAILGILAATFSKLLSDEFKAWVPWLIQWIIKIAVARLPSEKRERFAEEWPSHVNEIPGDISKLLVAAGFLLASWKISRFPFYFTKRVIDLVVAGLAVSIFFPLLALTAIAIAIEGGGPIFFFQTRLGKGGKPFRIVKFRTIEIGKYGSTPRISKLGSILRKSTIDELPQFINVLRGDMSMVGPRPLPPNPENAFPVLQGDVKPGLTGLAEVNVEGDGIEPSVKQSRIEHDLFYIDNRSILLDLKILLVAFAKWLRKAYRS